MSIQLIKAAVASVQEEHGSHFIDRDSVFSDGTRKALEVLATYAGVAIARDVSAVDLIALYAVAVKNPESAIQVASRINRKMGEAPAPAPAPAPGGLSDKDVMAAIEKAMQLERDALAGQFADVRAENTAEITYWLDNLRAGIPDIVAEIVAQNTATRLEIQRPDADKVDIGVTHHATPMIIKMLAAGVNVYLHGPPGSGKTTAARQAASAFGVPFHMTAKVESEYLLLGFKDANGATVRTPFREAYEHGGVFLFDELDGSSPNAIVALNAALANGVCPFPDGSVAKHADFFCIAAGNTTLHGANHEYSGRFQIDAASVDRFAFLEFGYDENLERTLASNLGWCAHVQAMRAAARKAGLAVPLLSPRSTYDGCALLAAGMAWDDVEESVIFKGCDADVRRMLRGASNPFTGQEAA